MLLKKTRQLLALFSILAITLLFIDFTGVAARWLGWMARIQLLPAVLALNVGVVAALAALTLLLGRVYCSVVCPLGIMQDGFARLGRIARRNRYSYSRSRTVLRIIFLALLIVALVAGIGAVVALLAPYSTYGRIVNTFLQPAWIMANNGLAEWSESAGNYLFATEPYHLFSPATAIAAAAMLILTGWLAWRNGRTYCNTVCPVGTVLGFLSRFSLMRPVIDRSKCNSCGLCARNCKSACIDSKAHTIDYSRCVACMDCLTVCRKGAISYSPRRNARGAGEPEQGRRQFMASMAALTVAAAASAQEKVVDGGLAAITDKQKPARRTPIAPPGAQGLRNLANHCTACQLCVANCPNGVLRPSADLATLMQPEVSYEAGYCRPECNRCSQVCPTGAIKPIDLSEKSSTQVGHAVWVKANCIVLTDEVECGNCARHCPTGAITMVASDSSNPDSRKIPAINVEACIGCGACENLCPSRPFSAIYVEGHQTHRIV